MFLLSFWSRMNQIKSGTQKMMMDPRINFEWFCTDTVVDETMAVFTIKIWKFAHQHKLPFFQSSNGATIPWRAYSAKVITLNNEILFDRRALTLREQGTTSSEEIDLKARGEPEQPPDDGIKKKRYMVQKLTRAILPSPNKDFLIKELFVDDNRNHHREDEESVRMTPAQVNLKNGGRYVGQHAAAVSE